MPAKHRGRGEGTIFKRANGRFTAQVSLDGKRTAKTFDTRPQARAWIAEMTQQVERGLTHAATKTTFAELFAAWLETRRGEVKPTAMRRAEQISRDLFGSLNPLKLSAIRPTHVQAAINAAVGTSTARKTQGILRQVFDHAMRLGLIGSNPADRARLIVPRHKPAEIHVLTEAQVNAILQAARPTRLYPLYLMAVTTGMRVSELLGLTWQDIDFSGSVKVWRQLEPGKDFRLSELKTKTSRRTLTLDPRVVDALREYREAELYTNPAGIVFTRETGDPLGHSGVRRDYDALLVAAGVPHCRFHDLRHTAASLMLANGVSVSTVAGILGHSSPAVTMRTYAHFIPQYQPAAAKILADLVLSQPIATGQKINTPTDRENAK